MPNNTNPNYTTGLNTPAWIKLTGQGVTNANPQTGSGALVGGNNTYKVTLSLSNSISAGVSATVAVTASLFDLAGAFQSIAGSVITALSYNNAPLAVGPGSFESWTGTSGNNPNLSTGAVASVGAVTVAASAGVATITPLNLGQAVVEFRYSQESGLIGGNGTTGGNPANPNLNSLVNVELLAGSAITGSAGAGSMISGGDVDIYPGTAVSNFPPSVVISPNVIHNADATAAQAQTDLTAAIAHYSGLSFTSLGSSVNLSTAGNGSSASTYVAGNYSASSSMDIPTSITLDAQGNANAIFVFKAGSTLKLESGASVLLINGAQAANVYWVVGSSFTSIWNGIVSNMVGTIMATISITLGGGTLVGRALASTGAVTIATTEAVTSPTTPVVVGGTFPGLSNQAIYADVLVNVVP